MVSAFRADEADGKVMAPGIDHRSGSQITTRDRRTGDRQLPVSNALTSIPGHESDDAIPHSCIALVGEALIVTVVASPHRKEAFVACEHLLEQTELSVAIWKKGVYKRRGPRWKAIIR